MYHCKQLPAQPMANAWHTMRGAPKQAAWQQHEVRADHCSEFCKVPELCALCTQQGPAKTLYYINMISRAAPGC